MLRMRVGFSVFLLYMVIYYLVPYVFGSAMDFEFLDYLGGNPHYDGAIIFCGVYLLLFVLCYFYLPKLLLPTSRIKLTLLNHWYLTVPLCLVYLVLAYKFHNDYGLQFRHKGSSLSEAASYVKVLLLIRLIINGYLIFLLSKVHITGKISLHQMVNLLLCAAGILLAATSSFDVLAVAVIVMILLVPITRKNFITSSGNFNFKSVLNIAFLFGIFVSVVFIGMANKIGNEKAIDFVFEDGLVSVFHIALARVSIFFYSLSHAINENIVNFDFQMQSVVGNLQNLEFRINTLLGADAARPELGSAGRINSEQIYINPKERNGAAPGMIGSIFYLPFFPFSIIVSILYLVFVTRLIDSIFMHSSSMSFLPTMFLLTVFQSVVDAQPDLLNLLGLGFLQLMVIYFVWLNRHEDNLSQQKEINT